MKVENKLAIFSKIAINEAEKMTDSYMNALNAELSRKEAEAARIANDEAEKAFSLAEKALSERSNKALLLASQNARHALFELREELTGKLFGDISKMLGDYRDSGGQYAAHLLSDIDSVMSSYPGERAVLTLHPADVRLFNEQTDVEIRENAGIIGGFIAVFEARGVVCDYSFARLLDAARADFGGFKIDG